MSTLYTSWRTLRGETFTDMYATVCYTHAISRVVPATTYLRKLRTLPEMHVGDWQNTKDQSHKAS